MTLAETLLGAPVHDLWPARPAGGTPAPPAPAGQSQLFDPDAPEEGNHDDPMDLPGMQRHLPLPRGHRPRRRTPLLP